MPTDTGLDRADHLAAGCDAFALARIAGHSSITITQRYCHPQADAIARAFLKLTDAGAAVQGTGSSWILGQLYFDKSFSINFC
jgi:hypothetical protein